MGMQVVIEDGVLSKDSAVFLQQRNKLERFCQLNGCTYREEDLVPPSHERNPYIATQFNSGALPPESQPAETEELVAPESEDEEEPDASGETEADETDDEEAELVEDTYDDEDEWSFTALKQELRGRELPQNGNRAALVARLRQDDATRADEE